MLRLAIKMDISQTWKTEYDVQVGRGGEYNSFHQDSLLKRKVCGGGGAMGEGRNGRLLFSLNKVN